MVEGCYTFALFDSWRDSLVNEQKLDEGDELFFKVV